MITKYLRPRAIASFCNLRRLGEPGPRRRLCVTRARAPLAHLFPREFRGFSRRRRAANGGDVSREFPAVRGSRLRGRNTLITLGFGNERGGGRESAVANSSKRKSFRNCISADILFFRETWLHRRLSVALTALIPSATTHNYKPTRTECVRANTQAASAGASVVTCFARQLPRLSRHPRRIPRKHSAQFLLLNFRPESSCSSSPSSFCSRLVRRFLELFDRSALGQARK